MYKRQQLLVNEIAPRPHNSGHHTIDVFSISQYEQQVRALCGLPLVNPLRFGNSVLLNVLGEEHDELQKLRPIDEVLTNNSARIYSYGKASVRKNRKMGHIMFLSQPVDEMVKTASRVLSILKNE